MAGGQDGGAVLQGDADHFGSAATGDLQLVADGADQQAVGRGSGTRGAQQLSLGIADAGDVRALVAVVPLVGYDAGDGGGRATQNGAVTDGGNQRHMGVIGVGEDRALGEQAVQAGLIFGAVTGQVIEAELIDHDGHDEFRLFGRRQPGAGHSEAEGREQAKDEFLHDSQWG